MNMSYSSMLRGSGQQWTGKNPDQCCLNTQAATGVPYKKVFLKFLLTGKHLCQSLFKKSCRLLEKHCTKMLCNVAQEVPDNTVQEKIFCSDVLILLGQQCFGKTLCNVDLEAPDNIPQEKSFSILS